MFDDQTAKRYCRRYFGTGVLGFGVLGHPVMLNNINNPADAIVNLRFIEPPRCYSPAMELLPWRWLFTPQNPDPPPMEEDDHYYSVEVETAHALQVVQTALEANPDDHHLEAARNHVSDAYLSIRRASARHREIS